MRRKTAAGPFAIGQVDRFRPSGLSQSENESVAARAFRKLADAADADAADAAAAAQLSETFRSFCSNSEDSGSTQRKN